MLWNKNIRFCDINPTCYKISTQKEIIKQKIRNLFSKEKFAKKKSLEKLPNIVFRFHSNMIKRAEGVDLTSQLNKAENIKIASSKINGVIVHPGETFSFWELVGKISKRRGYLEGRVIMKNKLVMGTGGGICNLANTINRVILHSPMTVTEFHKHSDALAPDEGPRVPLEAGTSVSYNYIDYRFRNDTDQDVQFLIWCEGEELFCELRSEREFPNRYELIEEGHHFQKEGEKYFRISKIYRSVTSKETGEQVGKELVWDNHSEVMFDYSLIPTELIASGER